MKFLLDNLYIEIVYFFFIKLFYWISLMLVENKLIIFNLIINRILRYTLRSFQKILSLII